MANIEKIVQDLDKSFRNGKTRSIEWRKQQLEALYNMLTVEEARICEALYKDLKKPKQEAVSSEILLVKADIAKHINNLDNWTKPEKVSKNMLTLMDGLTLQPQPYGVVLILGAWNYPVQLTIMPLTGAIAAGNCAVVKTSEVAEHTDKLLLELLAKYLDQDCIRAVTGGPEVATQLLAQRFDYIFYTGNSVVGRIVMTAAAKNLTPVTLEMGGKSPCYIHCDADLVMTSRRLVWGKFMNAGQTCIAPDYVLCRPEIVEPLTKQILAAIQEFYGNAPNLSSDYGKIVSDRQFDRLTKMIKDSKGKTIYGGQSNKTDLYIAPTVFTNIQDDDSTMAGEIFGPILPIMTVKDEEEAIFYINKKEKPLALYVFSSDWYIKKRFQDLTTSGGLLFNDVIMHSTVDGFPFGGVGHSGMGSYHGKFSFDTFSHKRPIMDKGTAEAMNNKFRYPPYNENKLSWVTWGMASNISKGSYCVIL